MNERILKIESKAWEQVKRTNGLVRTEDFNQKFAELIVRECGQWWTNRLVVEPDYGLPHRSERNRAVPGVIKEFKQHFGVEE